PLEGVASKTIVPALAATVLCAAAVAWRQRGALAERFREGLDAQAGSFPVSTGLAGVARIGVQILALLVVVLPLARHGRLVGAGLPTLVAVCAGVSLLAALANNLPASTIVAAGLGPGPAAYAALVGLSVGALAMPQGSVATLIAGDLTGTSPHARLLLPTALAAALAAIVVLWLT